MNDIAAASLRAEVESLPWFHAIDFGGGVVSPGDIRLTAVKRMADIFFNPPIAGKSLLDIGCWSGAYSIEAARRGASRVLATDHFVWEQNPAHRAAFDLARNRLAPQIEVMDAPVEALTVESVGTFDVVLFAGVLYHLRHPLAALEQVAKLANECLILETHMTKWPVFGPYMKFYPGTELRNDPTNWWGPNKACVMAMLRDVGFRRITFTRPDWRYRRGVFHAWRE